MKASQLIKLLEAQIAEHGDMNVIYESGGHLESWFPDVVRVGICTDQDAFMVSGGQQEVGSAILLK